MHINRLILFVLLLSSCSPEGRLKRILKKHPYLIETQNVTFHDTVILKDTIKVPGIKESHFFTKDSIIYRDRYDLQKKGNEIIVNIPPMTIPRDTTIYITNEVKGKVINLKEKIPTWLYWIGGFLVLSLWMAVIVLAIKK